jgi:CheY-like chemotaxis protein
MTFVIFAAGLDGRSLLLEASVLQRDDHKIEELLSGRGLIDRIAQGGGNLAVLGSELPDMGLPDLVRRIRSSPLTRKISILALVPTTEPLAIDTATLQAGANAVLRRPLDRAHLDNWLSKLLVVPKRVDARISVSGRVVGTPRDAVGHFVGLTLNLSANGMLLASPVRLIGQPDVDLEMEIPPALRLKALGRVVREAAEVQWPYLGYGVEFLYIPQESLRTLISLVTVAPLPARKSRDGDFGIHSTVRRDAWIFEILQPVPHGEGYHVEIHRAPRESWRPGNAGPFYVVEGETAQAAIAQARAFVQGLG